jgi:hypothetical protein
MKLADILDLDGIIIRKIPHKVYATYRTQKDTVIRLRCGESLISGPDDNGFYRTVKAVGDSLAGKYMVQAEYGTGSSTTWHKGHYGLGDTIEGAYMDLVTNKIYRPCPSST